MAEVNGSRRRYDRTTRRDQASQTRLAILRAAQELLESEGYRAATIAAIAKKAGVSPESVYKNFGSKAVVVKEVFDLVIGGDDAPVAVADRPETERIRAEPDASEKIRAYARQGAIRGARSAQIQIVIRDGRGDAALGALWSEIGEQRLTGMTMFGRHLLGTGQLRDGIELDEVRDVLWTYTSVEIYEKLVLQREWSLEKFTEWLGESLIGALVTPRARQPRYPTGV